MKPAVFLFALALVHVTTGVSIPEVYTTGTHYEVGKDIGTTFRAIIQNYYNQSKSLATVTQFIQTAAGKQYYSGYLTTVQKVFPQYIEELTGLADGAEVTFTQAFSMMIGSEIKAILKLKGDESCSDVYVNDEQVAIGHNEDSDPLIKDLGFLVHATIIGQSGLVVENFTAYTYPGALSGNAFGFNGEGKVFTINALYPALVEKNKIPNLQITENSEDLAFRTPRYFLNRATLSVKSQTELENVLSGLGVGVAYGFNVNYADTRNSSGILTNYEVSPVAGVSRSLVTKKTVGRKNRPLGDITGHYFHFNMYDHTNITQIAKDTVSSMHRKARAIALPVPANVLGITVILGDDGDSQYPIYRTPRPTDEESTVATGIFVLDSCVLMVYKSNPRTTARPIMTLSLPYGAMCQK